MRPAWRTMLVGVLLALGVAGSAGPAVQAGPAGAQTPHQLVETGPAAGTGRTIQVPPGGDLQAAVDAARPGDAIVLTAGATYRGPLTLAAKPGDGWLIIRSSEADALPAGQRVGPADAPRMARIVTTRGSEPAVRTTGAAHHVKLVGLELTAAPGTFVQNLVTFGGGDETSESQLPHHLVVERCYVHADAGVGGRRGLALNARHVAVVDSYVAAFRSTSHETQAIAAWNGPGPFKIVNNYLEAAGVNVLFGGADPTIPNLVPADVEVRRNHVTKRLAWRSETWVVKNLFELKNARRVLVAGNLFEHSWAAAQAGFAVVFTPRNQDGKAPWSIVEDVTFVNNVVRGAGSGVSILGQDDNHPSGQTRRIDIVNNLFADIDGRTWGGRGWLVMMLSGTRDVTIEHNTAFPTGAMIGLEGPVHTGFSFRNNIVAHGEFGVKGSGLASGEPTLRALLPGARMEGNVLIGTDVAAYPPGNTVVRRVKDVGFVDADRGTWRLAPDSRFKRAAGGRDPGIDVDRLAQATGLGERLSSDRGH